MSNESNSPSSLISHSIRGGIGGVVSSIICSPLDVIKTRIQARSLSEVGDENKLRYFAKTFSKIKRIEGPKGFFRGILPTLCAVPIFWTAFFPLYHYFQSLYSVSISTPNSPLSHILSAVSAGMICDTLTNPLWMVRTRIQTHILHSPPSTPTPSMMSMFGQVVRREGVSSLYKGLGASYLGLKNQIQLTTSFNHLHSTISIHQD